MTRHQGRCNSKYLKLCCYVCLLKYALDMTRVDFPVLPMYPIMHSSRSSEKCVLGAFKWSVNAVWAKKKKKT